MAEFYRLPNWALTALVMALALCIVLQTLAISYSIRRLPAGWARRLENGMECAVLAVLFIFAALLAQVQYALYCGFLVPGAYAFARQAVFLMTAVLGTAAAVAAELIWPFSPSAGRQSCCPLLNSSWGLHTPSFFLRVFCFSCSAARTSA
ncbi:MAG: hypothetical protein ACLTSG_05095 [Lachnospiraceae bacterium]